MTDQISFPPLRDLPSGHHQARRQHLLHEIADQPAPPRRSRSWKSVLVVAVLVAALACVVGVGIADSLGAFNGVAAAQHQRASGDVLDSATAAYVQSHLAGIQPDTARHIGKLPNGQDVYVITGSQGDLCAVLGPPAIEAECGDPLSRAHPATISTLLTDNNPAMRWIVWGLALNGVSSVSFPYSTQASSTAGGGPTGPRVTVPVKDNLWIYPVNSAVPPTVLQPVTAHFTDGTTVTEPATGTNCAAC